jgi:hypothetical protein
MDGSRRGKVGRQDLDVVDELPFLKIRWSSAIIFFGSSDGKSSSMVSRLGGAEHLLYSLR